MTMAHIFCLLCLAFPLIVNVVNAADVTDAYGNVAYDNGTIAWVDLPDLGSPYGTVNRPRSSWQDALFRYARGFLNSVQPKPIPFGLLIQVLDGTFDVGSQYMELVTFAVGLAVCVVLGLLFLICMPLCGCCLCCCRCCGNCGGKMTQTHHPNEDCKRMAFGQALFLIALCMGVSAVCVYVANEKVTSSLTYADTSIPSNFQDIDIYINNTILEFQYMAVNMYDVVSRAIKRDIDDIGNILGAVLVPEFITMVNPTVNAMVTLDQSVQTIVSSLDDVNNNVSALTDLVSLLTSTLNDLQSNITTTKATCAANCGATGILGCSNFDESVLVVDLDTSSFPDINSTLQSTKVLSDQNLTDIAIMAKQNVLNLPEIIMNSTNSTRQLVKNVLDDFAMNIEGMVDGMINQLTGVIILAGVLAVVDSADGYTRCQDAGMTLFDSKKYSDMAGDYITMARDYDNYRFYGAVGLMSILCLTVFTYILGICCGMCGYRKHALPTHRGKCSNCGGVCLLCGVFLTFLLSSILMLLTMITFILGGSMEKICEPLVDLTLFSEFIDQGGIEGFDLASMLLGNTTATISLAQVLRQCKGNVAPFNVLHLDELIPINTYLDYNSQLGSIDSQFSDIGDSVDLSSVVILDNSTEQDLNDFLDSGITSINFTQFAAVLSGSTLSFDSATLITAIAAIIADCSSPTSDEWQFHSDQLQYIDTVMLANIDNAKMALNVSLTSLESVVNGIQTTVNATIDAANYTQTSIQNTDVITNATLDYKDNILNYVEQFKQMALYLVYNKLAACEPLWNLYDSFTGLLCRHIVDSVNGFWFSIGSALFFFIPVIVLAIKLSKYYRRMDDCEGYEDEYDEFYIKETVPITVIEARANVA